MVYSEVRVRPFYRENWQGDMKLIDKFSEKMKFRARKCPKHILWMDNGISGLGKTCFRGAKNNFGVRSVIIRVGFRAL